MKKDMLLKPNTVGNLSREMMQHLSMQKINPSCKKLSLTIKEY